MIPQAHKRPNTGMKIPDTIPTNLLNNPDSFSSFCVVDDAVLLNPPISTTVSNTSST